ncbi:unnamed protein product [Paramecium pentaurelia]|uniref:Cilia- and flagella-associated protein 91 n=1 Tax=Paramecium pentaurelia TaxID=43138 RepID=A0A8S1SLM8_9CILI|nr:unnamed protein product [Paramecium pentaurelia]
MQEAYVLHDQYRNQSMYNYISGSTRPLYFKRPLVPTMTDTPIKLSQPPVQQVKEQPPPAKVTIERVKDVEIQTDYREAEAQTDPYTPAHDQNEDQNIEILALQHLKWDKGLPASIEELESIEWNREKVWFENALPPISDEASFKLRRVLMKSQEEREWKKKETDIKINQNERLYLLQEALKEREKDVEEKNAQRIESIKIKKTELKNRMVAKIQKRKIKILRKMQKSRKEIDNEDKGREIIEDYANFASKVYAGITREGLSLDKIASKYEVQPVALNTYKGLTELSTTIKPSILETTVNVAQFIKIIEKDYTRLEIQHKIEVNKARNQIFGLNKQDQSNDTQADHIGNKNIIIRPATPTYNQEFENGDVKRQQMKFENYEQFKEEAVKRQSEDKKNSAVILLQRLFRGRAMQNIMYEGKEKRTALIEELLTVAKIPDLPEAEQEEILMQQHEEKVKNAALEAIQGEVIAETLDMLSKELLRIKQEKRIAQMVKSAEEDRRLREIQEAGTRQAEQILRDREDVQYNQIMRVHQGTVDTYLHWIFKNTIEQAATRQATIMTNLRKQKMNTPVEYFERKYNSDETIIKDLVQQFLIPNVQRSKLQKQIQIEERRFNEAAKKSIQATLSQAAQQINQK